VQAVDLKARPGAEPLFEIGSVTKVFTGLLLAQRVERGELRLDNAIGPLLQPHVNFRYPQAAKITLQQLVTHTSCLPMFAAEPSRVPPFQQFTQYGRAQLWDALGKGVLGREPPCESRYSNYGFSILGELMAQRAGRTWEQLVLADIAQPLGLRDTRVTLDDAGKARMAAPWRGGLRGDRWDMAAGAPAGGLRATATDLLVFSQALLQGRSGPLGPAAERAVGELADYGIRGSRIGYAVIQPKAPDPVWVHRGITGSYLAEWIAWPRSREAVVILVSNTEAKAQDIARALVEQTWQGPVKPAVFTLGELRSSFEEDGGRRSYVRLKIAPGHKLPFSTITYRLRDRRQLEGIPVGAKVQFRAERLDGENTITALRLAPP
jgi:D-alanyl-D-alanine-carboxypeptidase/D-alanyl-D-alanine-endopeptidase